MKRIRIINYLTMKILTLFCLFSLAFFSKSVNAQMYIVTEELSYTYPPQIYYDSVFVTNPKGETIGYEIPYPEYDIVGHDSQLSIILNSIINLGYKTMYPIIPATTGSTRRIYYLAKP